MHLFYSLNDFHTQLNGRKAIGSDVASNNYHKTNHRSLYIVWKRSCMLIKGMHITKLGNCSKVIVDLKFGQLITLSFEWNLKATLTGI